MLVMWKTQKNQAASGFFAVFLSTSERNKAVESDVDCFPRIYQHFIPLFTNIKFSTYQHSDVENFLKALS